MGDPERPAQPEAHDQRRSEPVAQTIDPGTAPSPGTRSEADQSVVRAHFPIPDEAEPQDCSIWRKALDPSSEEPENADRIWRHLVDLAFGTAEDRAAGRPLPFYELSLEARESLSPRLRAEYESELAAARDPRSGDRLRTLPISGDRSTETTPDQSQRAPSRHGPKH